MKRTTRWMIIGVYYISQLFGIFPFSYDYKTGKVQTKLFVTIYCAIMSLLTFGAVPLMFHMKWKPKNTNGPDLHYKINAVMCLINIIAILITVIFNWIKRKELMETLKDLQHFRWQFLQKFQMSAKVEKYFENSIRSKFYCGFLSNITLVIATYYISDDMFNLNSSVTTTGLDLLMSVFNIIITHYYFAIMHVNVLLAVINEEVKRILNSFSELCKRRRLQEVKPRAFTIQCCQLADDLDNLAMAKYNLQLLAGRINNMYDVQGACVIICIYLNNISVMYMSYMIYQPEVFYQEFGKWAVMSMPCALIFYYADLKLFMTALLNLSDLLKNTGHLLKNQQPWFTILDTRLEKSLKNFSIQIASFPLEMKLVGLFQFCRPMVFAIFGSTISNAIVLIQYDYKNNINV